MHQRMKTRLGRAVIVGTILCVSGVAAAEQLWVKNAQVRVFQDKGAASGVIATVKKGDKLEVVAHDGKWVRVKAGDKEGYVFENSLSDKEVAAGGADLSSLVGPADASAMSSASAGKGLEADAEALQYGQNHKIDPAALNQLIALRKTVTMADWKQFTAAGKVGPDQPK